MSIQEYIIDNAKAAAADAFRYAKAVPEDKQGWKPLESGQSVISMCRELGMTPTWGLQVLTGRMEEGGDDARAKQRQEMDSWATVEACEQQFAERFALLADHYRSMTEEDFVKTMWLPFNGGRDHTYLELMDYPRWNCTYHMGQIAYIQTLYGDREMH